MKRTAQYPGQVFNGYSTGNPDRDERTDDCQPDLFDYDQLAAEIIATQTALDTAVVAASYLPAATGANSTQNLFAIAANGAVSWVDSYLPDAAPANGASYIVNVDANGITTWLPNYLPTSAPANGNIYNLDVDANGVVSWVIDANG